MTWKQYSGVKYSPLSEGASVEEVQYVGEAFQQMTLKHVKMKIMWLKKKPPLSLSVDSAKGKLKL